nr:DUF6587 family protein [Xanthomonas phaseoli]
MTLSLTLQYLVIAIALLVSLWVVMKKQFPGVLHRLRGALALGLVRRGRPAWMQALGRRVAPVATAVARPRPAATDIRRLVYTCAAAGRGKTRGR